MEDLNFKQIVETVFYPFIDKYRLEVLALRRNSIRLVGLRFTIEIDHHFSETYVFICKEGGKIKIQPLLWASFCDKYNYKETVSLRYPNNMILREILIYNLFLEATYIRMFCRELLDGDFSRAEEYQKKSKEILIEQYHYNEKTLRDKNQ